jgi:L-2,4-diaminobutyric acid acetyltransferase
VAECDSGIVGFISAYIHPGQADTLFVWQVAVSSKMRNMGIATSTLKKLLERPNLNTVSYIETTVTPSNRPSISFFSAFAEMLGSACIESVYFPEYLFGGNGHEDEILFRIGPISNPS